MYRRMLALAAVAVGLAALPATASAAAGPHYHLALGDSLAQGMQPTARDVLQDTNQGSVDDLFAARRARIHHLRLVKLGCGGETTTSPLTGKATPPTPGAFTATGPAVRSWPPRCAFSGLTTGPARCRW
jgi:hypothetical protein